MHKFSFFLGFIILQLTTYAEAWLIYSFSLHAYSGYKRNCWWLPTIWLRSSWGRGIPNFGPYCFSFILSWFYLYYTALHIKRKGNTGFNSLTAVIPMRSNSYKALCGAMQLEGDAYQQARCSSSMFFKWIKLDIQNSDHLMHAILLDSQL